MKKALGLMALLFLLIAPVTASADISRTTPITTRATIAKGYYALIPKSVPERALSIQNSSTKPYAPAVSRTWQKLSGQIFYITPTAGGTYLIRTLRTMQALSVKNQSTSANAPVYQTYWCGYNYQRWFFLKRGSYYHIQSSISKKCIGILGDRTTNNAPIGICKYSAGKASQLWKLVRISNVTPPAQPTAPGTVNGRKTLITYLKNALVPCGRTLYIWGGGWGGTGKDTSKIGYQSGWSTFFKNNAKPGYDYTKFRYKYGSGLDCSGFARWTLYNTVFTKSGIDTTQYNASKSASIDWGTPDHSTGVAKKYASMGWATYKSNGSDQTFKPGDVVSMDGHVWISLGQYSDGSVLVIHSSPKGVQISGTAGTAARQAAYYMKKYFPQWPYAARTVSSSYLKYVGKARWKVSGSGILLRDPEGVQKMSPAKVMKILLGT